MLVFLAFQIARVIGITLVQSVSREAVFGADKPYAVGDACYRFMVDSRDIYNNPECLKMEPGNGQCRIIASPTKRIIIYPCRNDELLNFVCIYPYERQISDEGRKPLLNSEQQCLYW